MRFSLAIPVLAMLGAMSVAASAETIDMVGRRADGSSCTVKVERHADGRVTALAESGATASAGSAGSSVASSSSAGGSSVQVQAGNGSVSSSTSVSGTGGASAGTLSVNGCTVSVN